MTVKDGISASLQLKFIYALHTRLLCLTRPRHTQFKLSSSPHVSMCPKHKYFNPKIWGSWWLFFLSTMWWYYTELSNPNKVINVLYDTLPILWQILYITLSFSCHFSKLIDKYNIILLFSPLIGWVHFCFSLLRRNDSPCCWTLHLTSKPPSHRYSGTRPP